MSPTGFLDLPDLAILDIFGYLSSFDAIQAFYDLESQSDRFVNLLIEARCFSSLHQLRLPLFHFVCESVLPRLGAKLSHLTLCDHQLHLGREHGILSSLCNLSSLHLINIIELIDDDNVLSYFLPEQLTALTVDFISQHHIEAQAYICEHFVFHPRSAHLTHCRLANKHGLQFRHLTLSPSHSIEEMTVQLKQLSDLHVLFDHLPNVRVLHVDVCRWTNEDVCRWTNEDVKYDYSKLPKKLPHLIDFALQTNHVLTFTQLIAIMQYLVHLRTLSFVYRNYDERGVDTHRLQSMLTAFDQLIELHFLIKFIYFHLDPKLTFENTTSFNERWRVHTFINPVQKHYLAYTQPLPYRTQALSTDVLLQDESTCMPLVTELSLTTHAKQADLQPLLRSLNSHFPVLRRLRLIDSFGLTGEQDCAVHLPNVHSLDASEVKTVNLFTTLLRCIPHLTHLHVNANVLSSCDLEGLLVLHQIKHLDIVTDNLNEVDALLSHFPHIKHVTVSNRKQPKQYQRKSYLALLNWFDICPRLYTIHIKTAKLSDLFYLRNIESSEAIHVHFWNEMLTLWR